MRWHSQTHAIVSRCTLAGTYVKLGLLGDKHASKLRTHVVESGTLHRLWLFRRNKLDDIVVFANIDPNEKFALFSLSKGESTYHPLQAKGITKSEDLTHEFESWQTYDVRSVWSQGDALLVFDNPDGKTVFDKAVLSDTIEGLGLSAVRELDVTIDRHYVTEARSSVAVYSGEELRPFGVLPPAQWCRMTSKIDEFPNALNERIGINNILPNSRRKIRAGVIPAGALSVNSVLVLEGEMDPVRRYFVLACINAMVTEYVMRPRLTNINLNKFRVAKIPIPWASSSKLTEEVARLAEVLHGRGDFSEEASEYAAIEALLAIAHGLTKNEVRAYIRSFATAGESAGKDKRSELFLTNVLGYYAAYQKELDVHVNSVLERLRREAMQRTSKPLTMDLDLESRPPDLSPKATDIPRERKRTRRRRNA